MLRLPTNGSTGFWIPKSARHFPTITSMPPPNDAAKPFITPEDLKNPGIWPTPEIMKTLHFVKDLGKDNQIIDQAWTRTKSQ